MHVCLVGIEYPPDTDFGGIATYQYLLAKALEKNDIMVTVICGTHMADYDYYDGKIHVIRLHTIRNQETVHTFLEYREKVKETIIKINKVEKIDIIETPEFSGELLKCIHQNIPVLVKLHTSYNIWSHMNKCQLPSELHEHVIDAENEVLKNADKIICCSDLLKQMMPKYHNITLDRIEVVPNMADLDNFYPLPNNHISNKILFCGSLERRKGIYILAKAIPLVLEKISDAIFEFVGNDNNKDELLKLLPIKYHKNLEFIGHKFNNELNSYYNEAKIGIIPSLFDNFPYVALEALSTELPIIASDNTGIKEMITDNNSGILYQNENYINLANEIVKLYLDDNKRLLLGQNGRQEILNKYSPQIVCEKMINIYKEVIKNYGK